MQRTKKKKKKESAQQMKFSPIIQPIFLKTVVNPCKRKNKKKGKYAVCMFFFFIYYSFVYIC